MQGTVQGTVQGTRQEILETLKEKAAATVDELAEALGLASVTVRYHLSILENADLLTAEKRRGHVGRPHYVYRLSDEARELFPKRYDVLTQRLLTNLKDRLGEEGVEELFYRMAESIASDPQGELEGKSTEQKLDALIHLLGEEGFRAQWEKDGDQYIIREYDCPYYGVAQGHPEVCCIDKQVITTILDASVDRQSWMVEGDSVCTFRVDCR